MNEKKVLWTEIKNNLFYFVFKVILLYLIIFLPFYITFNFYFLMPQFDTFSFFSQLFWVFFGFITLYLLFCLYLLPALATILKVRKRKLTNSTQTSNNGNLTIFAASQNTTINDNILSLISNWNSGISNKLDYNDSNFTILNSTLSIFIVKFEILRNYNFKLLSQSQLTTLFWA